MRLAADRVRSCRRPEAGLLHRVRWMGVWLVAVVGLSCEADRPLSPPGDDAAPPADRASDGPIVSATASGAVVLVGAGDIAGSGDGDELTAQLLDQVVAADGDAVTVFTTGDNAYSDGTFDQFMAYYDPTWGRHKARTRPSPGNHDYHTPGAAGYFDYFGDRAGPDRTGYYSYDVGAWHVISLNSEVDMDAGSTQEQWLRADLAATTKQCVLAYWHKPRFSSGSNHGNSTTPGPIWEALYDAEAEVVLAGHDHTYERFAPQDPDANADPDRGIREFVVGTGGRSLYSFGSPEPNSEVRYNLTFGVLKLTLSPGGYAWEFIPVSGTFTDSGSDTCHGATAGPASGTTSEISASPTTIVPDGSATATITVRLRDASGIGLTTGGDGVALVTQSSLGTLSGVADNQDGTYTATFTAGTTQGTATVTGTVNGEPIADDATVTLKQPSASGATSTITASPTTIVADGSATATITVQLKDANDINLTTGGDVVTLATTLGSLLDVEDRGGGRYTSTLRAGTTPGIATITGWVRVDGVDEAISDDATVTLSSTIALTATLIKSRGLLKADLIWSGATGTDVDISRNGTFLATTANDGAYRDNIDERGNGTYRYQVCEAEPPGRCSDVATAGDASNGAPTASFVSSCSDRTCAFTDASTDADGVVLAWAWDFGDGAGSAERNPSHTYTADGTYTVTLTVTDDAGNPAVASQSVTVPVSPPPTSAPTVTGCSPGDAAAGTQLSILISGTNFTPGAKADFGDGVTVRSATVQSATLLEVFIRVHPQAGPGPRTVTVTNPDGQSGARFGCFTVN